MNHFYEENRDLINQLEKLIGFSSSKPAPLSTQQAIPRIVTTQFDNTTTVAPATETEPIQGEVTEVQEIRQTLEVPTYNAYNPFESPSCSPVTPKRSPKIPARSPRSSPRFAKKTSKPIHRSTSRGTSHFGQKQTLNIKETITTSNNRNTTKTTVSSSGPERFHENEQKVK